MTPQDTSKAAFASLQEQLSGLRAEVYEHIATAPTGGLTCEEVETIMKGKHQTISARVCELHRMGMIKDSGVRRMTKGKRKAIVWVPTESYEVGDVQRRARGTPEEDKLLPLIRIVEERYAHCMQRASWYDEGIAGDRSVCIENEGFARFLKTVLDILHQAQGE